MCRIGILSNQEDAMPAHSMSLEDRQRTYDNFRTTFSGGRIEMLPAVKEMPARIIGRLLYRVGIYNHFHVESDHSDGAFVFAGWHAFFEIHEEQDGLVLLIGIQEGQA
jgi:hypothetical protein